MKKTFLQQEGFATLGFKIKFELLEEKKYNFANKMLTVPIGLVAGRIIASNIYIFNAF